MNVIETPTAGTSLATNDLDRFRLRRFIENLSGTDELERREAPVDLADIAEILDGNPRAVHFLAAGPEQQELVGNVISSRSRIARAFGVPPERLAAEIGRRFDNKPQIMEVNRAEAPAQEVVLIGEEADLTALPVHLQHGLDGAPYISASIDYAIDARTGWTNVGIRRLMLRGRRETGVDLVSPSDLRALYEASAAAGKPLPVSFVVGAHPADYIAAVMRMPVDELGIVASLRDAPLPVVKCVTNEIRVPAEARNAIAACLSALVNVKNVFVVDPDIDVTSDEQMDWAMATRFQPDRDLIVLSGMRTLPLDPSITSGRVGSKAGFDLTWPFGTGNRLETRVPEPPRFEGRRFASVKAALTDGPKHFEELMTAIGSRDGREIVRELEALRTSLALDRDQDGRYVA